MHVYVCYTGEAVYSRCLSSLIEERGEASKHLQGPTETRYKGDRKEFIENVRQVENIIKLLA